jgi:hypothetical protein
MAEGTAKNITPLLNLINNDNFIKEKRTEFLFNFYSLLNKLILSGEFYCSDKSIQEFSECLLKEIKEKIDTIPQKKEKIEKEISVENIIVDENGKELMLSQILDDKFSDNDFESFNNYRYCLQLLLRIVNRNSIDANFFSDTLDLHEDHSIFKQNIFEELQELKSESIGSRTPFRLTKINILLAEIDLNLDCSDNVLINLHAVLDVLKNIEVKTQWNSLIEILIDKSNFLLYKIYCRKYKTAKNNDNEPESKYYYDRMEEVKTIRYYTKFKDLLEKHYFPDEKDSKKNIVELSIDLNEIKNIHASNKIICNPKNKIKPELLNETITILKNKLLESRVLTFDSIALRSAYTLLYNSSKKIELKKDKEVNYKLLLEAISKHCNNEDSIDLFFKSEENSLTDYDYFLHLYYLRYINDFLDFVITEPLSLFSKELNEKLNQGESLDETINNLFISKNSVFANLHKIDTLLIDKAKSKIEKCKFYKLKPIYLSYEECIIRDVKHEKDNYDLFLDSSYILPNEFDRAELFLNDIEDKLTGKIALIRNLVKSSHNIIYAEKSLRKDVENKDFKLVQVLAMFISIATLAIANVKLSEKFNLYEGILLNFSFGGMLVLFNLLIYWMIKSDSKFLRRDKVLTTIASILILFSIGGYFFGKNNMKNNTENSIHMSYDSLSSLTDSIHLKDSLYLQKLIDTNRLKQPK